MHTVPIPVDTKTFTYTFMINDDDLFENDETFKLEIMESSLHGNVNREEPYIITITITDNDERE